MIHMPQKQPQFTEKLKISSPLKKVIQNVSFLSFLVLSGCQINLNLNQTPKERVQSELTPEDAGISDIKKERSVGNTFLTVFTLPKKNKGRFRVFDLYDQEYLGSKSDWPKDYVSDRYGYFISNGDYQIEFFKDLTPESFLQKIKLTLSEENDNQILIFDHTKRQYGILKLESNLEKAEFYIDQKDQPDVLNEPLEIQKGRYITMPYGEYRLRFKDVMNHKTPPDLKVKIDQLAKKEFVKYEEE